ncbi:hypothetical protein STEG23_007235, partial [Scotinomys teguina]
DCSLKIREPEVPPILVPGSWRLSKTAAVGLYFIFPGICTLSLQKDGSCFCIHSVNLVLFIGFLYLDGYLLIEVGKIFFNDFVEYVFCAFELVFFSFFYSHYSKFFVCLFLNFFIHFFLVFVVAVTGPPQSSS